MCVVWDNTGRQAEKTPHAVRFLVRDFGTLDDFIGALSTECLQYFFVFTENAALARNLQLWRESLRELRRYDSRG